jgi:hypothetical protein
VSASERRAANDGKLPRGFLKVVVLLQGVQAIRKGQRTRENILGGNSGAGEVRNLGFEISLKLFRQDRGVICGAARV